LVSQREILISINVQIKYLNKKLNFKKKFQKLKKNPTAQNRAISALKIREQNNMNFQFNNSSLSNRSDNSSFNEKKKTFIISKDNPKTWGKPSHNIRRSTMLPNYSNYKNKFKKVQIDTSIIRTNHLSPTNRRNHIVLSSPNSKTNLLSTSSSKKSILSSINSRGMALSPRKDNHYITNIIERTK